MRPWSELMEVRLGRGIPWNSVVTEALVPTIVLICMVTLGLTLSNRVRDYALLQYATVDEIYTKSMLVPILEGVEGSLEPHQIAALDQILTHPLIRSRTFGVKIWSAAGTVVYGTNPDQIGHIADVAPVRRAAAGHVTMQFDERGDEDGQMQEHADVPLIETYLPIVGQDGAIDFVAEYYHDATDVLDRLQRITAWIWGSIGLSAVLMIVLIGTVGLRSRAHALAHREELENKLQAIQRLSERNESLKRVAEAARASAIESNQIFLSSLGSHLHDGAVQMLALLMIELTRETDRRGQRMEPSPQVIELASSILHELRNISHGLILPELEELDGEDVVALVIRRHEAFTGSTVELSINGEFPEDFSNVIKMCLYRVIQESLNNSYKHAHGAGQVVEVAVDGSGLEVIIRDRGEKPVNAEGDRRGLGLIGLQRSVHAVAGSISFASLDTGGTEVRVRLPLMLEQA